jgi:hypothetical protein
VIRPNVEFDDNSILYAETMAPFYIFGNQGLTIFTNNTFTENIGTTGGVIHFEQPDMMGAIAGGRRANIVIKENKFRNNMAYFAGNAFHLTYRMRMYVEDYDAQQVCGAGILIEDNSFIGNIGLKKHNGGVGVIRCEHLPTLQTFNQAFEINSGLLRYEVHQEHHRWNKTLPTPILEDPQTHTTWMQSEINDKIYFKFLTYGTLIRDNTFSNNHSGKKGTALLIEKINEVQIIKNTFLNNGPVTAYTEI